MPSLRLTFMGTPELACASLQALLAAPERLPAIEERIRRERRLIDWRQSGAAFADAIESLAVPGPTPAA